jgi:DNA polymerase III delta subunit
VTTWSQWFVAQQKEPKAKQVTFLCGSEPILIDEVVTHITTLLGVSPWNYVALVAGEDSDRVLWAELERHPIDQSFRLVVVRDAEKIKDRDRIEAWAKNKAANPKTYLVLISNEQRIPTVPAEKRGEKPSPEPHVAALARRGQVIECRPFTQATARHAITWVRSKVHMPENVAAHLLNRANGDLRLVRDTCVKLAVLDDSVSISVIDAMLSQRPRIDFREALLQRRKKDALFSLTRLAPEEYGRVLGQIDADLDLAGLVYDLTNQHATQGEIVRAAGKMAFLVPHMQPIAKHYDPKRRTALRRLLAVADEAVRGGERIGVMESLVAQW